jgi:glycine cleavage system H lipoate-binding protein
MNMDISPEKSQARVAAPAALSKVVEVFGFKVPTSTYYLHRGHTWAVLEDTGQVRVGMDDFSQKILGPAETIEFPEVGRVYYQDHVCMALVRQGHKAKVLAPVDGVIEEINSRVQQQPGLVHDDPYGEGWLFLVKPTNLNQNLDSLYSGEINAAWIDQESHRLLGLMDTTVGATLPDGGTIIDDVYGHFPKMGWRRLVQEFLLKDLTKNWKKRG